MNKELYVTPEMTIRKYKVLDLITTSDEINPGGFEENGSNEGIL